MKVSINNLYFRNAFYAINFVYPLKEQRNFGVRRGLKGGDTNKVITLCSLNIFQPNLVGWLIVVKRPTNS